MPAASAAADGLVAGGDPAAETIETIEVRGHKKKRGRPPNPNSKRSQGTTAASPPPTASLAAPPASAQSVAADGSAAATLTVQLPHAFRTGSDGIDAADKEVLYQSLRSGWVTGPGRL